MAIQINLNEKYALIAMPRMLSRCDVADELQIETDLWIKRSLPFGIAEHWREWIGSIATDELEKANLFLLTKGSSAEPATLDGDNIKRFGPR